MRKTIDISIFAGSKFRSKFSLDEKDVKHALDKGANVIRQHAVDFITSRLVPDNPNKDGKQTPMRGHPVFIAQHATATCCRKCLQKWHSIPMGKALTDKEVEYVVSYIMNWIREQVKR